MLTVAVGRAFLEVMSWASEWDYLSSCDGRQKGCLLDGGRERHLLLCLTKKVSVASKTVLIFPQMVVTVLPRSNGWEESVRVQPREPGSVEPSAPSQCAALAKSLHGKPCTAVVGWEVMLKSPIPWQGMESREVQ